MAGLPYLEFTDHIFAIGDPVHINETSPYFADWRGVKLWFAGVSLDQDGKVTFRVTQTAPQNWREGRVDITDEIEPFELSAGHLDADGEVTGATHRLSLVHANQALREIKTRHDSVRKQVNQVLIEIKQIRATLGAIPEQRRFDPMGAALKAADLHLNTAAIAAAKALKGEFLT